MPPLLVPSSAKRIATQMLVPLDETHLDAVRGLIELKGFHPSVSTSRARRSLYLHNPTGESVRNFCEGVYSRL